MTRISKLPVDQWDPDLRAQFAADEATALEQGAMRIYAHRPAIAKGLIALGGGIKRGGTLPPRLIELVRLRVAFHNQCRSCLAIRYRDAVEDGVDENLVCSLEKPSEAPDLTEAERAALAYADRFATDHLSIDDAMIDRLRGHFDEGEIVELASWIAFCVGFGRLGAVLHMVEEIPEEFASDSAGPITPWAGTPVLVR
ncbi:carboxymuconolactone decarboxylase family protein [Sphingomonas sp. 1P06PA]|uniref:carboxymuconolactone decarboxylase family protein n=1 Tax=Sphingomonas sp. 1P06PA TaxID=554121 RepID=UPI0039A5FA31